MWTTHVSLGVQATFVVGIMWTTPASTTPVSLDPLGGSTTPVSLDPLEGQVFLLISGFLLYIIWLVEVGVWFLVVYDLCFLVDLLLYCCYERQYFSFDTLCEKDKMSLEEC